MGFLVLNKNNGQSFVLVDDPLIIKTNLDALEVITDNLVRTEAGILGRHADLSTWHSAYLARKQSEATSSIVAAAMEQTRSVALAKLTSLEKSLLGLT